MCKITIQKNLLAQTEQIANAKAARAVVQNPKV